MIKKIVGVFMMITGAILAFFMTLIILSKKIETPNFDLFSVCLLFLVPLLLISVGYAILESSEKKE